MLTRLTLVPASILFAGAAFAQSDDNFLEATTQPATGNVAQGATDHHCVSFGIIRASNFDDTFTGLIVRNNGTAGATDFVRLRLWHDINDNDVFEPGTDVPIAEATSAAFPVTFGAFSQTQMISGGGGSGGGRGYFVTVDVSAGATPGATFVLAINTTDVTMTTYPVSTLFGTPVGPTQTITGTAAPDQIVVTQHPGGAVENTAFTTQPVVELRDSTGALLSADNSTVVTADITTGTGPGGASLGPVASLTAQASGGVANFSGLMIDQAGTGYTLTFTAGGFTDGASNPFDVTATAQSPTQLAVTTQPGGAAEGAALSPQPVVEIRDSNGALVGSTTNDVTASLNGPGTLAGTQTVQAVNGVATFTNLSVTPTGTGYTLTFTSTGLTDATSNPFDITSAGSGGSTGGGGGGGGGCTTGQQSPWLWLAALAVVLAGTRATRRPRASAFRAGL